MNHPAVTQYWLQSRQLNPTFHNNHLNQPGSAWTRIQILLDYQSVCRWQDSLSAEASLWTQSVRISKIEHKIQNVFAVTFELAVEYLVNQVINHSLTTMATIVLPIQDQDRFWLAYNHLSQINDWPRVKKVANRVFIEDQSDESDSSKSSHSSDLSDVSSDLEPNSGDDSSDSDSGDSGAGNNSDSSSTEEDKPKALARYFLPNSGGSADGPTTLVRFNLPIPALAAVDLLKVYHDLDYLMTATGVYLVPAVQWPLPLLIELPDVKVIPALAKTGKDENPKASLLCSNAVTKAVLQDRLSKILPVRQHNLLPDRSDLPLIRELLALAGVTAVLEENGLVWYRMEPNLKLAEEVECLTATLRISGDDRQAMYAFVIAYRGKFSYSYQARWQNGTAPAVPDSQVATIPTTGNGVYEIEYYVNTLEEKQSFEVEFQRVYEEVKAKWPGVLSQSSDDNKTVSLRRSTRIKARAGPYSTKSTKTALKPVTPVSEPITASFTNSIVTARKFHLKYPFGAIFVETTSNYDEIYWLLKPGEPDVVSYQNIPNVIIGQALNLTQDIDVITLEKLDEIPLVDLATGISIGGGFYRAEEVVKLTKDPLTRNFISRQARWDATVAPNNHLGMGLIAVKPVVNESALIVRRGNGNETHTDISLNFGKMVSLPDWLLSDGKLQKLYCDGHYLPQVSNIYAKRYKYNLNTRMSLSMGGLLTKDELSGQLEVEWLLGAK